MKTKSIITIKSVFLRLFLYILVLFSISKVIEYDMNMGNFKESSLTEKFQESFILAISLISYYASYKYKKYRVFLLLLGSFALISFIREMDATLENNLFDKAWQVFATLVLLPTLYYVGINFHLLMKQLRKIEKSISFGIILLGVVVLHVFSRLYGRKVMWKQFMGEDKFIRAVKDASEESIELLGYSIMLIGTIELYKFVKEKTNKKVKINK